MRAALCAGIAALAAALPAAALAEPAPSLPIGETLRLSQLGGGAVELVGAPEDRGPELAFRVPRNEGNGKPRDGWVKAQYLFRLDTEITIPADTGPGSFYVTGMVNGRSSPQVGVTVKRGPGGELSARWGTFDLVEGTRTHRAPLGRPFTVSTTNFLPWNSVRPGLNRTWATIERYGRVRPSSAVVLASSSIEATEKDPAKLVLRPVGETPEPAIGEPLKIEFEIANAGDLPAYDVRVMLEPQNQRASSIGRTEYVYEKLSGKRRGSFFVMPERQGDLVLELLATSDNANKPSVMLGGTAERRSASVAMLPPALLGLAVLAIGLLAFCLLRRRSSPAGGDAAVP